MGPDTLTPSLRSIRTSGNTRSPIGPRPPEAASISVPRQSVSVARFTQALLDLNRPSIERRAAGVAARISPDDDVAWWEATTALNRALRRQQTGRQAAMAAHRASQAVLAAASRTGLAVSADILAVARSAGEAARVLVAGNMNLTGAGYLTRGWEAFLFLPAGPPFPSGSAGRRGRTPSR
jgi:hypothetical protein